MKNIYLTILLLSVSSVAFGADFRAVDIGESCSEISTYEKELGSEASGEPDDSFYAYNVSFMEMQASVVYTCQEGVFIFGFYSLEFLSVDFANQKFPEVLAYFQGLYGEPLWYELKDGYGSSASWSIENRKMMLVVSNVDNVKARMSISVSGE